MLFQPVSASDAVRIAGLKSVAMLDYLERSSVFVPADRRHAGRGRRRLYDFRELLTLKVIATLLANGASVAAIKDALQQFQKEAWQADVASLGYGTQAIRYLIVSAKRIYFGTHKDNLYDLSAGSQMTFNFVIDLDHLHSELCNSVRQQEFEFLRTAS